MRASAHVVLTAASESAARAIVAALGPDNGGFLRARAEGTLVHLEGDAPRIATLLSTLDDALVCAAAALGVHERTAGDA
ncbi:MAG TPA: KEOPS complex subunit Pcc1 [Candidatus Thermoplasmatota archaeon]|nr:KEOPS complex subunit Pcc1 [Candidatus Thermoplasmatota archaeon]